MEVTIMEQGVPDMAKKKESRPATSNEVCNAVMQTLGTPPSFCNCSATNVFGNFWRVNVRVYKLSDQVNAIRPTSISDSFLVKVENSKIVDGDTVSPKYSS